MQFSLVTVIAALSATASGWSLTAYSGRGCRINPNAADEVYRKLEAPFRTECYTFGQDMPGVSCFEVRPGGGGPQGCTSGELIPQSVLANGDCIFYGSPNCGGSDVGEMAMSSPNYDTCIDVQGSRVMSYQCNQS
ncbi:hypothetical protein FHETE_9073 [Fusarium heterosporum]|uniref:Secreted LysM effector LysM C-terminal domain-containing protein n=1 Tax=Fusarium heterosporum TaxID=42747 RepID=A0A8H5SYQ5_FUSHE|nr:hypothetical protein FHETE_9073 [Fusarium heterosporum]